MTPRVQRQRWILRCRGPKGDGMTGRPAMRSMQSTTMTSPAAGNFRFITDKTRRSLYGEVWNYMTYAKLWGQVKTDVGKVFLQLMEQPSLRAYGTEMVHGAAEEMHTIQKKGWQAYVLSAQNRTEEEYQEQDNDRIFFTTASGGKMSSSLCEHGQTLYSCMPCSH